MKAKAFLAVLALSVATATAQTININMNAPHCVVNINSTDSARVAQTDYTPADIKVKERKFKNVSFGLALGGGAMVVSSIPLLNSAKNADSESARTMRAYGFTLMGIGASAVTVSVPLHFTAKALK